MHHHLVHILDILALIPGLHAHGFKMAAADTVNQPVKHLNHRHPLIDLLRGEAGTLIVRCRSHYRVQLRIQHDRNIRRILQQHGVIKNLLSPGFLAELPELDCLLIHDREDVVLPLQPLYLPVSLFQLQLQCLQPVLPFFCNHCIHFTHTQPSPKIKFTFSNTLPPRTKAPPS